MGLVDSRSRGTTPFRLPDGNVLNVPDNFTKKEWEELLYRVSEYFPEEVGEPFYESQRTPLGAAGNFLASIPRGAVGTLASGAQGIAGLLTPGFDTSIERGIRGFQQSDIMNARPEYMDTTLNKLGSGIGSTLPFLGTGAAAKALGYSSRLAAGALGATAGAGEQTQRVQTRRDMGEDVSGLREFAATTAGALVGTTEAIPVERYLRAPGVARDAVDSFMAARLTAAGLSAMPRTATAMALGMKALPHIVGQALIEGGQEATALVMQDMVQKNLYDPSLRVGETALDEFLIGGSVGGIIETALMGASGLRRRQRRAASQVWAEDAIAASNREMDITNAMINANEQKQANLTNLVSVMTGQEVQGEIDLNDEQILDLVSRDFIVSPSMGGGFNVTDGRTGQVIQGLVTMGSESDARVAASKLNSMATDLAIAVTAETSLRSQGLDGSPTALRLYTLAEHPDAAMFPTVFVAGYDGRESLKDSEGKDIGPYASLLARHPDAGTLLSASDIVRMLDPDDANYLFLDRAAIEAKTWVDLTKENRTIARNNGEPVPLAGAVNTRYIQQLARSYNANYEGFSAATGEMNDGTGEYDKLSGDRLDSHLNKQFRNALRNKNIGLGPNGNLTDPGHKDFNKGGSKDPNLSAWLEGVVGESDWRKLGAGQKALAIVALQQVPASPTKIRFPSTKAPLHTADEAGEVLSFIRDSQKKGVTRKGIIKHFGPRKNEKGEIVTEERFSAEVSNDIINALAISGVADVVDTTDLIKVKQERWKANIEERTPDNIEEEIDNLTNYLDGDNKDIYKRYLLQQFGLNTAEQNEEATLGGTPEQKSEWVYEASAAVAEAHLDFRNWMTDKGLDEDFMLATLEEGERMVRALRESGSSGIDPNQVAAFSGPLNQIMLFASNIDPNGEMSGKQLGDAVMKAYKHEIMHGLIVRKYFSDSELEAMARSAKKSLVPKEYDLEAAEDGLTWYDLAKKDQQNRTSSETAIEAEAMAMMFEAFTTGALKQSKSAGLIRTLFTKPKKIFEAANESVADSYVREALSVFSKIESGKIGERGPGRDHLNPEGEIRAPRFLLRDAPSEERAREIIDRYALEQAQTVETSLGVEGAPATKDVDLDADFRGRAMSEMYGDATPSAVDQRDMFQLVLDDATNGTGQFDFVDQLNIGAGFEAVLHPTPEGVEAVYEMTLSGPESDASIKGLAKLFGDALGMPAAETKVVLSDATVGDGIFGVVLDIPSGVRVRRLRNVIAESFGDSVTIEKIGDQLVILDSTSMDESYGEDDAIAFAEVMASEMAGLDIIPYGFFVELNQYEKSPTYPGIDSYENALESMEGLYDNEQDKRIWAQQLVEDGTIEIPSRLPRTGGAPDIQRSAISHVFEPIAQAIEKQTGEKVERPYFRPMSAISPVVETEEDLDNMRALEEVNQALPNGYVTKYGNSSSIAAKEILRAAQFGFIEAPPELAPRFSTKMKGDPITEEEIQFVSYEGSAKGNIERSREMLDSPDTWGAVSEFLSKFKRSSYYEIVDRWLPLRELDKLSNKARGGYRTAKESIIGAAALMLDQIEGSMSSATTRGPIRLSGTALDGGLVVEDGFTDEDGRKYKGLFDLFKYFGPNQIDEKIFDQYMIGLGGMDALISAERAQAELALGGVSKSRKKELRRRIARSKGGFPGSSSIPGMGKVHNIAEAKAALSSILAEHAKRNPDVLKFATGFRAWNGHTLKLMVDAGLVDPDSDYYEDWTQMPNFVPFYRTTDKTMPEYLTGRYKKNVRSESNLVVENERRGWSRPIEIPLADRIMANYHSILRDASMNITKLRVVDSLEALDLVRSEGKGSGIGNGVIVYHKKGEKRFVQTIDPMIAASLSASSSAINVGPVARTMIGSANIMRSLITRTPTFNLMQFIRDPASAWFTTGAFGGLKGLKDVYVESASNILSEEAYQRAQDEGITLEYDAYADPYRMRQSIQKAMRVTKENSGIEAAKHVWDMLGTTSKKIEASSRMAVFDKVLEETGDIYEARLQAHEVINFARRGANPWMNLMTAMIPFSNARIQGTDVIYRTAKGEYSALGQSLSPEEIRRQALGRGVLLMSMSLGLRMMWRVFDEEEYQNIRKEVREDNWLFPMPFVDKPMKLPVPFEAGMIFKTIPEIALNAILEKSLDGTGESLVRAIRNTGDIGIVPQFLSPIIDVMNNKDGFTRLPIVPFRMGSSLQRSDQYNFNTHEGAVIAGQILNVSPMKLEYLANGYFPGLGIYAMSATDAIIRAARGKNISGGRYDPMRRGMIPLVRGVTQGGGGLQQQYYDLQEDMDRLVGSLGKLQREGDVEGYRMRRDAGIGLLGVRSQVNSLRTFMMKWRASRDRTLRDTTMSRGERMERIKVLEAHRDTVLAVVPALKEAASGR